MHYRGRDRIVDLEWDPRAIAGESIRYLHDIRLLRYVSWMADSLLRRNLLDWPGWLSIGAQTNGRNVILSLLRM